MVNLAEGNMKHLITKIAYLLNKYPSTRNSDITLQLKYWREFERFNIEEKTKRRETTCHPTTN